MALIGNLTCRARWALAILVTLTGINLFIFHQRSEDWHCKKTGYSLLYYPEEALAITGFHIGEVGLLRLDFSKGMTHAWQVHDDAGNTYGTGAHPVIRLLNRQHEYTLYPEGDFKGAPVILKIDFCPRSVYEDAGLSTDSSVHLISSSIPVVQGDRLQLQTYLDSVLLYESDEVLRAHSILDRFNLDGMGEIQKIHSLAAHLLGQLEAARGSPDDAMMNSTPLQAYERAIRGEGELWCGNFAQIYTFFANVVGIPTRMVVAGGSLDGVNMSGHGFCESYIRDENRWMMIDLNARQIGVKNEKGVYLNTVDVFHAALSGTLNDLSVDRWSIENGVITKAFDEQEHGTQSTYFGPHAVFSFSELAPHSTSIKDRVTRYLGKERLVYSLVPLSNFKYWMKLLGLGLELMTVLYVCTNIRTNREWKRQLCIV